MASIFKNNIIKRKVEVLTVPDFDNKLEIIKNWHNDYHNGTLKEDKESSREQAFNQDFFIKILGYEEKPQKPYSLEPKATTEKGQLPDVILGYFDGDKNNIASVVELKGSKIPLDRPQKREGNHSPIQQAFKYKTQYSHCPFVIASNFYEFRLFQDNQLDYEIWTLDDLINPENDYFQFKKFFYLLNKDNFTSIEGKTKTEELLSDIRVEEEKISKKFYKEYRELRTELLRNIYQKNSTARSDIDLAIEKAQKIIDRIVFVCFCEDQDLLPEDTLQRVLMTSENGIGSLWDTLKGFFNAIDLGSEKLEIPDGYNGGLFHTDNDLDNLKIDDDILRKFTNLGKYNFREDLSVNILGHIFEQSISDLEDIKIKIEEKEVDNVGKRKKDGIFYTPDYIVDYIIKNSLGKYLEDKETELKEKHKLKSDIQDKNYEKREKAVYEEYRDFLQNVKVLDPACGSGAFLVKVFDYLLEENKRVGHILGGGLFSNEVFYRSVLKNNIFGVDLNNESVEITKLSLWLKTAQKGKKLTTLDNNIKCGNSLIDDKEIAGEKAFDWNKEFKDIMEQGGFDVVVGNPPYVFARGGSFSEKEKEYYYNHFDLSKYQINTYILFTEKAHSLLKNGGVFGYIIPNNWQTIDTCVDFRKFIFEELSNIKVVNSRDKIFEDANVDNGILIFNKNKGGNYEFIKLENNNFKQIAKGKKFDNENYLINFKLFENKENQQIVDKINTQSKKLGDVSKVSTGIKVYQVGKGVPKQTEEIKENRIFHDIKKVDENYKKYLEGKDVIRYCLNWSGQYLNYGDWVAEPRKSIDFSKERILVRQIPSPFPKCINSIYTDKTFINDINSMVIFNFSQNFYPKYILTILNSKLTSFWFVNTFDKLQRGLFPQFKVKELAIFPIKEISKEEQKPFIELADKMLDLNKQFYEKKETFSRRIKDNYSLEKLTKKLQKFYEMEFGDFVSELRNKGGNVPLSTQDELEEYFNQYKTQLLDLQEKITKTDKEIDNTVYKLYGLNEEEIKIVEGV